MENFRRKSSLFTPTDIRIKNLWKLKKIVQKMMQKLGMKKEEISNGIKRREGSNSST